MGQWVIRVTSFDPVATLIGVPPFCLACIGTDNKFDSLALIQRWKYIIAECDKRKIVVLSFGEDGDSRIMKCMKVSSYFNTPPSEPLLVHVSSADLVKPLPVPDAWVDWFFAAAKVTCYVQDTVHVAVKLKCRLLKPGIVLPMGNFLPVAITY